MKKSILLLFLVNLTMSNYSQNTASNKAEFKFTTELIDYGKIEHKSDGKRIFEFVNVGKSPLIISNIKASCGCTVPTKPDGPIMPGEKGVIEVVYNTSILGGFSKMITITSNAKNSIKRIRIKGFVVKKS